MIKKKRRLKTWPIILLFCIVIFGILIFCVVDVINSLKGKNTKEIKILNTIESYNYTLNENDSAYFETLFGELKTVLESEELEKIFIF